MVADGRVENLGEKSQASQKIAKALGLGGDAPLPAPLIAEGVQQRRHVSLPGKEPGPLQAAAPHGPPPRRIGGEALDGLCQRHGVEGRHVEGRLAAHSRFTGTSAATTGSPDAIASTRGWPKDSV